MVLMKKFSFLLLLLATLTYSATEDTRKIFLNLYYSGKYQEAHTILRQAFSDPLTRNIWEQRIHVQQDIQNCDAPLEPSARAAALLRIGLIEKAQQSFGDDWLSWIGRATISGWKNDFLDARHDVNQALRLKPDDPVLLYYAGLYAGNDDQAVDYFQRYLKSNSFDIAKRSSARQTVEFFRNTKGLTLNEPALSSSIGTIDSQFNDKRLLIHAKINQNQEVLLLVDTGAAGLSLKDKKWKARNAANMTMIGLGVKQRTRASLVVFDQFSAGMFQLRNPVAAVSRSLEGNGIDGIVGPILFSKYNVLLPMKNDADVTLSTLSSDQLINQLKQKGFEYKKRVTLPFYQVGKMIILKGQIKKSDETMDILLDTGAQTSILSAAAARKYVHIDYPKTFRDKRKSNLFGLGGRIENVLHVENVEIRIGPLQKSFNQMVAINLAQISEALDLEVDAILGQDFLSGYTLLIDYQNNLVTFLS
jgi:hypothetical protein